MDGEDASRQAAVASGEEDDDPYLITRKAPSYLPDTRLPFERPCSSNGGELRVVAVVPFDEEDESPFAGLLQVEASRER